MNKRWFKFELSSQGDDVFHFLNKLNDMSIRPEHIKMLFFSVYWTKVFFYTDQPTVDLLRKMVTETATNKIQ